MLCAKAKNRHLSEGCSGALRHTSLEVCRADDLEPFEMVCQRHFDLIQRQDDRRLGLCTLCFCFPTKMLHLNAPFFPLKCSAVPKKVTKMLNNTHHREAFFINSEHFKGVYFKANKVVWQQCIQINSFNTVKKIIYMAVLRWFLSKRT